MNPLFEPLALGALHLKNRIVMAPLARCRASEGRVPNALMASYYAQRATAGLILAEATAVSPQGVGHARTPGIWCSAQIEGWRKVTQSVHDKGGTIFLQLWHVGRVSDPEYMSGGIPVAPSSIACPGRLELLQQFAHRFVTPRALRADEIAGVVQDYAQAARNAREAGFDGVEVHAANGYLIDQFLHDGSNQRQDQYGGNIPDRTRFLLEVVDACIGVWGAQRVGVHLSPGSTTHGMHDSDPVALFNHVARVLYQRNVAFVFVRQSAGAQDCVRGVRQNFDGSLILNGNFSVLEARALLHSGVADAVAFGRAYIANPDLVARLRSRAPLNPWDDATFLHGEERGYVDYPALDHSPTYANISYGLSSGTAPVHVG